MVTELQSNVLSVGTVRKVMPACMIYALVQSATFMVDTIVAGHFMGADAIAAVAMGLPIMGLMLAFTAAIMHGGFTMVQRMAQDITYSYSYHLNVVSIKIDG